MLRRRHFCTGLAGALYLLPNLAHALPSLASEWRFSGGAAERERHQRAIDAAADAMPFGLRDVTRTRVARTNPIEDNLEITITEASLVVAYPALDPMRSPRDGSSTLWRNSEGDKVHLTQILDGDELTQIIKNAQGYRRTIFRASGGQMAMKVVIDSRFMPVAVKYTLTYRASG